MFRQSTNQNHYPVCGVLSCNRLDAHVSSLQPFVNIQQPLEPKELIQTITLLILALSLACLEIRKEMRRRFIPDETGFTYYRLFTSYFIDGRVFFRTFTFYIVFDDLFLNWFLGTDHLIFVGVGRGVGNFFWVWIFFFSALLFAGILFHQNKSLHG